MTITEAQRLALHRALRDSLGGPVAQTLMEHLPPSGWGDVARRADIDVVRLEVDVVRSDVDHVKTRFDGLDEKLGMVDVRFGMVDTQFARIDQRFDSFEAIIDTKFDALERKLDRKFDECHRSVVTEISLVLERKLNQQLRWIITFASAQFLVLLSIAFR